MNAILTHFPLLGEYFYRNQFLHFLQYPCAWKTISNALNDLLSKEMGMKTRKLWQKWCCLISSRQDVAGNGLGSCLYRSSSFFSQKKCDIKVFFFFFCSLLMTLRLPFGLIVCNHTFSLPCTEKNPSSTFFLDRIFFCTFK